MHEGAACIKCQLYSRLFLVPVLALLMRGVGSYWCWAGAHPAYTSVAVVFPLQ